MPVSIFVYGFELTTELWL